MTTSGIQNIPRRRWRLLTWPFPVVLIGLVAAIEAFPTSAFIASFFGSLFWIGILLNVTLILFALDALRGAMPRYLALLPAGLYLAYLIACAFSHLEHRAMDERLNQANAAQSLPFDPASTTFIGKSWFTEWLVAYYDVPVAYEAGDRDAPTGSSRVVPGPDCDSIQVSWAKGFSKQNIRLDRTDVSNACLLRSTESPDRPAIVLTRLEAPKTGRDRLDRYTLTAPDGRRATLLQGTTGVLPLVPLPLVGCTWFSKRECYLELFRWQTPVGRAFRVAGPFPQSPERNWVARALGVAPRLSRTVQIDGKQVTMFDEVQTARLAVGSKSAVASARRQANAEIDRQILELDHFLVGRVSEPEKLRSEVVALRADRLGARAPQLLAALIAAPAHSDLRRSLGQIISVLPDTDFQRIAPEFLVVVKDDPELRQDAWVTIRLGDAGSAATPLLEAQLRPNAGEANPAYLGLCRAGQLAAPQAEAVFAAITARISGLGDHRPDIQAAAIALARMGRPDLAARTVDLNLKTPLSPLDRTWLKRQITEITPASPRRLCARNDRRPNLPDLPWLRG